MARSAPDSFDRVFARPTKGVTDDESPPTMHELFTANMRDELSLENFIQAMDTLHGVEITPSAYRLMTSSDGTSGRLSYRDFMQAMKDGYAPEGGAGLPMVIKDQAAAIISDNCGKAVPGKAPSQCGSGRPSTDINNDPFIKQQVRLERAAAKGPFPGNPVVQTNHVSAGNPLCEEPESRGVQREGGVQSQREMANTATRMYTGGDITRQDYETFLHKSGVPLIEGSELQKLILNHDKVGDGNFAIMMRAINRQVDLGDKL